MSNTQNSRPSHRIYSVTKDGDEKARWTEHGAAWPHKDGKGFQLKFNACPIGDCEIVLREAKPKDQASNSGRKFTRRTSETASAGAGAQ